MAKARSETFRGRIIAGKITVDWPKVAEVCREYGQFVIEVRAYDREREISLQQMRYFHGVIVPLFVEYTGDSDQYWINKLKIECGAKWFEPQQICVDGRMFNIIPSKTRLTTSEFSEWYQNIRDFGDSIGVLIPPPDPAWRTREMVAT